MRLKTKIIIFILMFFSFGIFSAAHVRAGTWGEDIMAEEMGQMQDMIEKLVNGVIMGAAKQAAIKAIEGQISNIVSGGGSGTGGAMFVTNWQEYLYQKPAEKTKLFMNDWFDAIGGGRSSSSNYLSAGSSGNYVGQLVKQTKDSLLNNQLPTMDIQEYAKDPTQPFAEGNWRAFNALISNPVNNAFGLALSAQQAYLSNLEQEQQKAMTQAIAYQGFLATTEGGSEGGSGGGLFGSSGSSKEPTVTTPGIITKEIQAYAENMSGQTVVNARDIPEVITALVTKLVTKTITQGIGKAAQNAQRNDSSTGTSGSQSNNSSFGIFGNFGQ